MQEDDAGHAERNNKEDAILQGGTARVGTSCNLYTAPRNAQNQHTAPHNAQNQHTAPHNARNQHADVRKHSADPTTTQPT